MNVRARIWFASFDECALGVTKQRGGRTREGEPRDRGREGRVLTLPFCLSLLSLSLSKPPFVSRSARAGAGAPGERERRDMESESGRTNSPPRSKVRGISAPSRAARPPKSSIRRRSKTRVFCSILTTQMKRNNCNPKWLDLVFRSPLFANTGPSACHIMRASLGRKWIRRKRQERWRATRVSP